MIIKINIESIDVVQRNFKLDSSRDSTNTNPKMKFSNND